MTKREAERRLAKLRAEIDHHRYLIHVKNTQSISEAALDSLKRELTELEEQFPELITPDSPSQRVAGQPLPAFKTVTHRQRMLSLNDVFDAEGLRQWEARNQKIVPADYDYFVQPKIDGVAVALLYRDGHFVRGATRGDGSRGEDVAQNLMTIEAIPLTLRRSGRSGSVPTQLEVRGEVYMLKKDFAALNAAQKKAGKPIFANPRNVAAGSIRQLDPRITAARPLRFFAWEIAPGSDGRSRAEEYEHLQALGFPTPPHSQRFHRLDDVADYLARAAKRRERYPFLVDGAVVKVNDLALAERLGVVGKAPRGSVAFKFEAEESTTVVEDIVVRVGRTGVLTPVAHLKPVRLAGTAVSRATLHNADEIARKDVRVGDTVVVHKAGDIIPEIVRVLPKLRPRGTKPFRFPRRCPMCRAAVERDVDGVAYRCTRADCFSKTRERIIHAVGRESFDIEGLGEKIIEQLVNEGLIEDPADLWKLQPGDLLPLAGFAQKKAEKLVHEILGRQQVALPRFLIALSIPQVGTVTAQDLAREFHTVAAIRGASEEKLAAVEGVGPIVARSIRQFFDQPATMRLLNKYAAAGVKVGSEYARGPLVGKTFVFSGALAGLTREEAKQLVLSRGGKVASTVGQDVDYVVVGEDPGSKAERAKALGLKIVTLGAFRKMVRGNA